MTDHPLLPVLTRIADALDRLSPIAEAAADLNTADAWIWNGTAERLEAVEQVRAVPLDVLQGIDHVRDILMENTRRFAAGLAANNALLWGARGMGKSSLVKAVSGELRKSHPLTLIEIHREEIASLPALLAILRAHPERRFILFCDDLSFDRDESSYKSLKSVLDGGLNGRPENVVFYATSNRRHLMPREMMENERQAGIHPGEGVEERVSLSDRFGLWLGFYACDQETYLAMIDAYAAYYQLPAAKATIHAEALEWAVTRGGRSGRVAWQFITDLAGRAGKTLG